MTFTVRWSKKNLLPLVLLALIVMLVLPGHVRAATMTVIPDTVTEQAGFDQDFTLTLTDDQFISTVSAVYVELGGDFQNLSVGEVVYKDSTTVTAQVYGDLSYGTGQGTITIDGDALAGGDDAVASVEVLRSGADQDLVLHLEFEDNLNDSSGMGNDGEVLGNPDTVTYIDGVMGRAALFPGVDAERWGVKVPTSQSLEFNEEVSISFYARLDNERGINEYGNAQDKGYHSFFRKDGDTKFVFLLYTNDRHFETFHRGSNLSYAIGEWMRITIVVSADRKVVVYKNKQKVMELELPQDVNLTDSNDKDLFIGAWDTALSWYPLWGAIDDFRIYNRALTEAEVTQLVVPTLSDLKVGGKTVTGFNPHTYTYDVELPYGTTVGDPAAEVTAAATDAEAELTINQAAEVPGTATVVVRAEDGTERTYTVNLNWADPVSADINPDEVTYDLNNPTDDVSTTITWNDAGSITGITNGETPLTLDSDYTVQGDTLTVSGSYLAGLGLTAGGSVTLTVSFDVGEAAQLTVTVLQDFAGGKGTAEEPYLIANAGQLDRLRYYLGPDYANYYFQLQGDIDLNGREWQPVGQDDETGLLAFTGSFDGNGQVIRNLTINRPDEYDVGLFGYAEGAVFRNVILENVNVSGQDCVGGLVGSMREGAIEDSIVDGSVHGDFGVGGLAGYIVDCTVSSSHAAVEVTGGSGSFAVGGLVGFNAGGTISGSYAVKDVNGNEYVGGLAGLIDEGTITGSHATGNVTGNDYVGGLAGAILGEISESYATGAVNGDEEVGGLVGFSWDGNITNSYATGTVTGNYGVGGLVGTNVTFGEGVDSLSEITNTYATGEVVGVEDVGGLVGYNELGTISGSYAAADVTGEFPVGGLVGNNIGGTISHSYVKENVTVTGDYDVGGLVGSIDGGEISDSYSMANVTAGTESSGVGGLAGTVSENSYYGPTDIVHCYATGAVTGDSAVGGLVGDYRGGTITGCYYDSETTGRSTEDNEWGTPKTTAEMMQQATFEDWDFDAVWGIQENNTYPYLRWQDRSGFTVAPVQPGSKTAGEAFDLSITGATGIFGSDLNGSFNVTVTSDREDGEVFNAPVTFTGGTATVPVTLTELGEHTLTVVVAGVSGHRILAITVEEAPAIPDLTVRETNPTDGAANVSISPAITVTFSENIEPGTEYAGITMVSDGNNTVAVSTGIDNDVLTINPDNNLSYGTEYTVTIPAAAVRSAATGASLGESYDFSFTTRSRPSGGGGGGGSSSNSKTSVISDLVQTEADKLLDEALANKGEARLSLADADGNSAVFSSAVIEKLDEVSEPLTVENTGIRLHFPPGAFETEQVTDAGQNAAIQIGAREITGEEKQAILDRTPPGETSGLFEIGGRIFDLSALILPGGEDSEEKGTPITEFGAPVTVTINLSHPGELTGEEISRLTGVRLEIDAEGNVNPVPLGGYDPETKTFTFRTDRFGLYTVMMTGDQQKRAETVITLTLGQEQAVVNDTPHSLDTAPYVDTAAGRTLVPVRFVSEALGAEVKWEAVQKQVTIADNGRVIIMTLGSPEVLVEGETQTIDSAPRALPPGRTFVPLRFVSETLDATVDYDSATRTITITK